MKSKPVGRILKLIAKDFGFNKMDWGRKRLMQWEQVKSDPFRSLIGTVLSQRTRDENTSLAAERLFSRYKSAQSLARAPIREIERLIKPSGFYKVKARRIKEISRILVEKYKGKVPDSMEGLCSLPGVGRKTSGCVLVYSFGKNVSIPTDTHVNRVSNRIGLVKTKTPEQTEKELMKIMPRKYWIIVNELFVTFGKKVCRPIGPRHEECPVNKYCDYYKNLKRKGRV
jgi:endonuclease-3